MLDVYVYTYIIIYRHYFQQCDILRNAEKYIIVDLLCMKSPKPADLVRPKSKNKKVRTTRLRKFPARENQLFDTT